MGATGLLGSAMMRVLVESDLLNVLGTVRSEEAKGLFRDDAWSNLLLLRDAQDDDALTRFLSEVSPDVVVNCVSPSRQALIEGDPLQLISICALLPHRLSRICAQLGARLIHVSTDGVFSGNKGGYTEKDEPDAVDVYGLSKRLGEPRGAHSFTIRTSLLGHELRGSNSLLEWFLSQEKRCNCYSRAVFSGLPAVVLAQIVRDVVLPRPELSGVYHIAAEPITKCELLRLIADVYGKSIEVIPDDRIVIDRSLNAERFQRATGYSAPDWKTLIQVMHSFR